VTPDTDPVDEAAAGFLTALSEPSAHEREMDLPEQLTRDGAA
jgi:hypothetical protein